MRTIGDVDNLSFEICHCQHDFLQVLKLLDKFFGGQMTFYLNFFWHNSQKQSCSAKRRINVSYSVFKQSACHFNIFRMVQSLSSPPRRQILLKIIHIQTAQFMCNKVFQWVWHWYFSSFPKIFIWEPIITNPERANSARHHQCRASPLPAPSLPAAQGSHGRQPGRVPPP